MKTFEIAAHSGQRKNDLQYRNEYKSIDPTRITELKKIVLNRLKNIGVILT